MAARLDRADLQPDPAALFRRWFDHARDAGQPEPEAMALATVGPYGTPSVRFVLMRGFDQRGVVFYTNRRSRKGRELGTGGSAAVVFRWASVDRQVRLAGPVTQVDDAESDAYFASRPRGSQLGAWASAQSEPIADRGALEARYHQVEARFEGRPVPRPDWWGGYRIEPVEFEFWQQGDYRLHDRFAYTAAGDGTWQVTRLCP